MLSNPEIGELVSAECRGTSCRLETVHTNDRRQMEFSQLMSKTVDPTGEGMQGESRRVVENNGRVRVTSFYRLDHSARQ